MHGPLHRFLADDHRRLEGLFERAVGDPAAPDPAAYAAFRAGLLRHIAMEEKILLPAARQARGGEPLPIAERLRRDHGAIAALLVPSPTPAVVAALRTVLAAHNPLEEDDGGLYDACEALVGDEAAAVLERLRASPAVPVAPHVDGPRIVAAAQRALERAGYALTLDGA